MGQLPQLPAKQTSRHGAQQGGLGQGNSPPSEHVLPQLKIWASYASADLVRDHLTLHLAALLPLSFVFLCYIYSRLRTQSRQQLQSPQLQVEMLAAAIVVLQIVQFIFCHERFRRSHRLVQWGARAGYYVPVPLAASAVGVMLRFQCPYWLVAIFFAAGQSDTMSAYSLHDDRQNLRRFAKQTLCLAYLAVALQGAAYQSPMEAFSLGAGFLVFLQDQRIRSRAMIPSSNICMAAAEHVGFKVPSTIREPDLGQIVVSVGSLESYRSAVSGCTTYKDIMSLNWFSSSRFKDVCLSSALFLRLLRLYDTPQVDCSSVNLLFKKLLAERGGCARAVKIVEVQLSFMFDYFFTAHGSPCHASHWLHICYCSLKIVFLLSVLLLVYCIEEHSKGSALITSGSLCVLILLELCKVVGYLRSNWFLVSYMSNRTSHPWAPHYRRILLPGREASSVFDTIFEGIGGQEPTWQNKLEQYSLVEHFDCASLKQRLLGGKLGWPQRGTLPTPGVELSAKFKAWIFYKPVDSKPSGIIRDGVAQERQKGYRNALEWTINQETKIHTILIWHIATWFCDLSGETSDRYEHRYYATYLSRYCAYLVAFHPELLPGHHIVTTSVFDDAVEEAENNLKGETSSDERYQRMETWDEEYSSDHQGILKLGVKLGRELMDISDSPSELWDIIADFWAEMLLFVAQFGNVTAHIEHLAKGGQFVTHLWALLSNTGIQRDSPFIKRNKKDGNRTRHPQEDESKGQRLSKNNKGKKGKGKKDKGKDHAD